MKPPHWTSWKRVSSTVTDSNGLKPGVLDHEFVVRGRDARGVGSPLKVSRESLAPRGVKGAARRWVVLLNDGTFRWGGQVRRQGSLSRTLNDV